MTNPIARCPRQLAAVAAGAVSLVCWIAPAPAAAGTAEVPPDPFRPETSPRFFYTAAPGELNRVTIYYESLNAVIVTDTAGVTPGRFCSRVARADTTRARCAVPAGIMLPANTVTLGDRDDWATETRAASLLSPRVAFPVTSFFGGPGGDTLSAGYGSEVEGGDGDDVLRGASGIAGGRGNDILIAGSKGTEFDEDAPGNGSDIISGGPGDDSVSYRDRRRGVRLDLAGDRDDGEQGESDRIGATVESLVGGHGDDRLSGNAAENFLWGESGTDVLRGGAGNDELDASPSGDEDPSERTADRLYGGSGDDALGGSDGPNLLSLGPGQDRVGGAGGNDTVRARDRSVDDIGCGAGRDRARIDQFDLADSCERRRRSRPAGAIPSATFTLAGGVLYVTVDCPSDGPPYCRGTASVLLRGASTGPGRRFKIRRGKFRVLSFGRRPALVGKTVVAEVRSADRRGRLRIVRRREHL